MNNHSPIYRRLHHLLKTLMMFTIHLFPSPVKTDYQSYKSRIAHEREFLRILLLHGHKTLQNEHLADYLFAKVKAIPFIDDLVSKILELYKQENDSKMLDLGTFQNICLEKQYDLNSIFNEAYEPSKSWARFWSLS